MSFDTNEPPIEPQNQASGEKREQRLRSIQYFTFASALMCLMSIILPGGIYTSFAAVIFAGISLYRIKKLRTLDPGMKSKTQTYKYVCITCIIVGSLVFVMMVVAVTIMLPMITELYESGALAELGMDTSALDDYLGNSGNNASPWD